MLDVLQAARQRRSIRRFADTPVPREAIEAMLEAARLAPTGVNLQPLAFAVTASRPICERVFPHTRWARKIPDGSAGPTEETQPTAYIVILVDQTIAQSADNDAGAAAMSIMLTAEAQGIANCWLANVDRQEILEILGVDSARYKMHTLVALGYPKMRARAVPLGLGQNTVYYLESPDSLCVPKRAPADIIHWAE